MFWIAEKEEDLDNFNPDRLFVELILHNDKVHPALNDITAIYLREVGESKGYIIPVDHTEGMNVDRETVLELLSRTKEVFVRDKKQFLYYYNLSNISDINFIQYKKIEEDTKTHEWYYRKHSEHKKINSIIPLAKHYEKCENIYKKVEKILLQEKPTCFKFYNRDVTGVFWFIEQQGLTITSPELYLKTPHLEYSYQDAKIYTCYNLNTTTTRPSNAFNNINFAGLNKEDGTRKFIVPENDFLLEVDLNAYHPTLIANIIGYTYEEDSIYEHFSKLLDVDIAKAKELTFIFLYKGVPKEYMHLKYFKEVDRLIRDLWEDYCSEGFIECPISNYRFEKILGETMNPQKLFNYYIQNLETSTNVRLLKKILPKLVGKSKLILYTYDAFLFDAAKEERHLIKEILNIFEEHNLKVKISYGSDYDSLTKL